ncbi:alpha/beta hydrolase [Nocardiopsis rhodophaea]|uniref:Alpha/beta hydrolase n=1 Tax=Nocardiopsis rhodophaea TaxID=280238 RepID=A0ABN2T553_9ACTN
MASGTEKRGCLRPALGFTCAAVAVILVYVGLMWGLQRSLIYLPSSGDVPPAAEVIDGARDVTLTTEDGLELGAWFVPARETDRGMAVLVANGNAGNRQVRAPLAEALAEAGLSVLLFDYRGYGGNPGRPSESGLALDADAAAAALKGLGPEEGYAPEDTLYFGESLGAAVVTSLAQERPPAGLVLRSPFTELADVGRHHYPFLPVRTLLAERYPVTDSVRGIEAPITVVYGTGDTIVPPDLSREVAAASPHLFEEIVVDGAGHNHPALLSGPELTAAVVRLADHVR